MFKKFISVTAVAIVASLSSHAVFAHNAAQNIINSPEHQAFFQRYNEEMQSQRPIVVKNSLSENENGKTYSFKQGNHIEFDNSVLESNNFSNGHKDFVKTIAKTFNSVHDKGYYKNQAQVNIFLSNKNTYNFYSAPEIYKQYVNEKSILEHNSKVNDEINILTAKLGELQLKEKSTNNQEKSSEYLSFVKKIEQQQSLIKSSGNTLAARSFLDIEKNLSLFDKKTNPSQIFVLGANTEESSHKNHMQFRPDATNNFEQCSTIISVDRNGDQVNLLHSDIDRSGMILSSNAEKEIFSKFVLLHEMAHCEFSLNSSTNFKSIKTGDSHVDKVLNDFFNPTNKTRYSNPFTTHLQEHYADTYAAMVLLREEPNKNLVQSMLQSIKKSRAISSTDNDFEHLTSYSLQQLEHPEILAKIKTLPVEKLPDFALEISQKGVALTLAESKEFQKYLNKQVSMSLIENVFFAFSKAVEGKDFNSPEYSALGLGAQENFVSQLSNMTYLDLTEKFKQNPALREEMKIFISSSLDNPIIGVKVPNEIKNFEYSPEALKMQSFLVNLQQESLKNYVKEYGSFNDIGERLKNSLAKQSNSSLLKIASISSLKAEPTTLSTSILPKDINYFTTQFSLKKSDLEKQIFEVSKQAENNRNKYINAETNISIKKL